MWFLGGGERILAIQQVVRITNDLSCDQSMYNRNNRPPYLSTSVRGDSAIIGLSRVQRFDCVRGRSFETRKRHLRLYRSRQIIYSDKLVVKRYIFNLDEIGL